VAAREIEERGDLVFVGMRCRSSLTRSHATRTPPTRAACSRLADARSAGRWILGTMGDPPNVVGALWATRCPNVMALMAQGSWTWASSEAQRSTGSAT